MARGLGGAFSRFLRPFSSRVQTSGMLILLFSYRHVASAGAVPPIAVIKECCATRAVRANCDQ